MISRRQLLSRFATMWTGLMWTGFVLLRGSSRPAAAQRIRIVAGPTYGSGEYGRGLYGGTVVGPYPVKPLERGDQRG